MVIQGERGAEVGTGGEAGWVTEAERAGRQMGRERAPNGPNAPRDTPSSL